MATHSSILAWRIPKDRGAWRAPACGVAESDMTEQLSIVQWSSEDRLSALCDSGTSVGIFETQLAFL